MKTFLGTVLILMTGSVTACTAQSAQQRTDATPPQASTADARPERRPVLVELFTSEGCSSCPPADRVLTILQNDQLVPNAIVITLGYHVDYWDTAAWRDRFSLAEFSRRQEAYARHFQLGSPFTPQIIVDGADEILGSNRAAANEEIAKRAADLKGVVELRLVGEKLRVNISALGGHQDAGVYLAVAEGGLASQVRGGENSGSKLEHSSVVRYLHQIGSIRGTENGRKFDVAFPSRPGWKTENLRYVVFVQESSSMKILAVDQFVK